VKLTDPAGSLFADPQFAKQIEKESGQKIRQCIQCGECTAGCPAAFAMDNPPNRMMRMAQLGLRERLLGCHALWLCASCNTCVARCPRNLDLARVMDALRAMALREQIRPAEPQIAAFHRTFLDALKTDGRVAEVKMIALYKLRSGNLFQDVPLGIRMFLKGKLALGAARIKGAEDVRRIFSKAGGIK